MSEFRKFATQLEECEQRLKDIAPSTCKLNAIERRQAAARVTERTADGGDLGALGAKFGRRLEETEEHCDGAYLEAVAALRAKRDAAAAAAIADEADVDEAAAERAAALGCDVTAAPPPAAKKPKVAATAWAAQADDARIARNMELRAQLAADPAALSPEDRARAEALVERDARKRDKKATRRLNGDSARSAAFKRRAGAVQAVAGAAPGRGRGKGRGKGRGGGRGKGRGKGRGGK